MLNHPNIMAIYDIGAHDGSPYVVSELLEGETLRERLAPSGGPASPLPPRKATDYMIQLAHGLAAAHQKGIVHRDLKPENIFLTTEGRLKILDFGLAKLAQSAAGLGGGGDRAHSWTHTTGRGARHQGIHVPGTGARQTGGRPVGHLFVRRDPL